MNFLKLHFNKFLFIFSFLFISFFFFHSASASTYYVSTNGNDNNSGTIGSPFATWQKGMQTAVAGDTVYIRGGVYYATGILYGGNYYGVRIGRSHSGTALNHIKVFAYPGETPILDGTNVTQDGIRFGILLDGVNYWDIKGLTVRNFKEYENGGVYKVAEGWGIQDSTYIYLEDCIVHGNGSGFASGGNIDYIYYTNCDSYDNVDFVDNGGFSNGFSGNINSGKHVFYYGCRSWLNSDDGFDMYGGDGYITIENSWAFLNGLYNGNGAGFKTGKSDGPKESGVQRTLINNMSWSNTGIGFDESQDYVYASTMEHYLYNNTSYHNGFGFNFGYIGSVSDTIRNNISFSDTNLSGFGTNIVDHNSWQNGLTVTSSDFLSLDSTGADGPRQSDGSLPNLNFLKLAQGSSLIDAGIDVGLPYNGLAPDISAYESNYTFSDTTAPVISSFTIPATSSTLAISFSAPVASDNVGVTGYLLTETATTPSAASGSWTSSAPTAYTFSSQGPKTLYAWAKDAAGKVSVSFSDTVDITLPPTTATTFTFTGPTSGNINTASTSFIITPNNTYTGTITITPSGTGSTGLSTITKTFSSSAVAQTFTITPTVAGSITLTATNSGSLTNPSNLTYTANAIIPGAPTGVTATASNASATVLFLAPSSNGGSVITGYTVTSSPSGGTDTNAGNTSLSHSITGLTNGTSYTFTVKATNAIGQSIASSTSSAVIPSITPDITKPLISSFIIPITSTSLSISGITLSATDTIGVTGYLLNETGITPNPASGPWSSTPQTSYPFSSAGTKTLYAFAKDTAGNISLPTSQSITITLPVVNNNTGGGGGGGGGGSSSTPPTTIITCPTGTTLVINTCINNTTNVPMTPVVTTIPTTPTVIQPPTPSYTFTTRMTLGTKSNEVIELQKILIAKGYLNGLADGSFGPKTLYAVKQFQLANNLIPDGIIGTQSRSILNQITINTTPPYTPTPTLLPALSPHLTEKLVYHSVLNNLSQVKILQTILISKGYLTGTIDGVFGRGTLSSVKAFQIANNLVPDGIVGAKTREILNTN